MFSGFLSHHNNNNIMNFIIDNEIKTTLSELIDNNDFNYIIIQSLLLMDVNDIYHIGICEIKKIK